MKLFRLIALYVATVVIAGCCRETFGAEPPPVKGFKSPPKVKGFRPAVDDTPTDLSQFAPPGWEKVSIDGGPWHFRRVEAAPAVAAPRPFSETPTPAQRAGGYGSSWTGSTLTVVTPTVAPWTGPYGATSDCGALG